jgi:hypothetical protein
MACYRDLFITFRMRWNFFPQELTCQSEIQFVLTKFGSVRKQLVEACGQVECVCASSYLYRTGIYNEVIEVVITPSRSELQL